MVDVHGSFYSETGKVYLQTASGFVEVGDVADLEEIRDDVDEDRAATEAAAALVGNTATSVTKTANYTAQTGDVIDADTIGGAFTITLPAGGGTVLIRDSDDTWATNVLTVAGNGATIDGAATLNLSDFAGYSVTFTRRPADAAWRYSLSYIYGA